MSDAIDVRKLPGLKADQLTKCGCCKNGLTAGGGMTFYRLTLERYVFDPNAVRRAVGLEMQIGRLAQVIGPNEDLAKRLDEPKVVILCQGCGLTKPQLIAALDEETT